MTFKVVPLNITGKLHIRAEGGTLRILAGKDGRVTFATLQSAPSTLCYADEACETGRGHTLLRTGANIKIMEP